MGYAGDFHQHAPHAGELIDEVEGKGVVLDSLGDVAELTIEVSFGAVMKNAL